jgi:hypothetical protein
LESCLGSFGASSGAASTTNSSNAGSASASHPLKRREVIRLQSVQRDERRVLNEILALLDELAVNTIDRQLAKSDTQLGAATRG